LFVIIYFLFKLFNLIITIPFQVSNWAILMYVRFYEWLWELMISVVCGIFSYYSLLIVRSFHVFLPGPWFPTVCSLYINQWIGYRHVNHGQIYTYTDDFVPRVCNVMVQCVLLSGRRCAIYRLDNNIVTCICSARCATVCACCRPVSSHLLVELTRLIEFWDSM